MDELRKKINRTIRVHAAVVLGYKAGILDRDYLIKFQRQLVADLYDYITSQYEAKK